MVAEIKLRLTTNLIFTTVVVSFLTIKYWFSQLWLRHFKSATDGYLSYTGYPTLIVVRFLQLSACCNCPFLYMPKLFTHCLPTIICIILIYCNKCSIKQLLYTFFKLYYCVSGLMYYFCKYFCRLVFPAC